MERLNKIIEELNREDEHWLELMHKQIDDEVPANNKKIISLFNEFWQLMRETLKLNYEEGVAFYEKEIGKENGWLLEYIIKSLQDFFDLTTFREIQKKDSDKGKEIIRYLWENAILLFDPDFAKVYLEYGFENSDVLIDTAKTLDGMVCYYVRRHFTMHAISEDLKEEAGFETSICNYIVSLIQKDYQTLQMNMIIDGLHNR